ncbi:MAG: alpha/beta fold hydrolase [Bacteroidales bacterium]
MAIRIPSFTAGRLRGLLLLAPLVVAGCSSADLLPGRSQAGWYARHAGWSYGTADTGSFFLATALSPSPAGQRPLAIYIEGDGRAFVGDRTPSADPTPLTPIALRMALAHPGPAAWIGRPCQFTTPATTRSCHAAYWSSHRYAPEVVESMNRAVDELKQRSGARSVILVGYSGGGAVAALLAARRSDVAGLVTASANLDIGYWVARDGLAPLTGSLDPAADAQRLRAVPQVHFAGRADDVVPPDVARSYLARLGEGAPAGLVELAGVDHRCCWVSSWPDLVRRPELSLVPGWN